MAQLAVNIITLMPIFDGNPGGLEVWLTAAAQAGAHLEAMNQSLPPAIRTSVYGVLLRRLPPAVRADCGIEITTDPACVTRKLKQKNTGASGVQPRGKEYWWTGMAKRGEEETSWMGLGKRENSFTHFPSVGLPAGVLSDMRQFFDDLRNNVEILDSLPPQQRDALLGRSSQIISGRSGWKGAYSGGFSEQRPSYKIRNFVDSSEPITLRGTNRYDPSLLWTGLGKRRR
ncbi:hypothetical protein AAG570_013228 [Ranatra chinensis]|uniref:Uncharacterized protein n=1 Tax=Ranatra chinensis TaxID=642074 RepID=A0ABD0YG67_9HEMI